MDILIPIQCTLKGSKSILLFHQTGRETSDWVKITKSEATDDWDQRQADPMWSTAPTLKSPTPKVASFTSYVTKGQVQDDSMSPSPKSPVTPTSTFYLPKDSSGKGNEYTEDPQASGYDEKKHKAAADSGQMKDPEEETPQTEEPEKPTSKEEEPEDCPICLSPIEDLEVLSKCSHKFCQDCIKQCFQNKPVCPICGVVYGKITGKLCCGKVRML